jgi:hypothetical protein
MTEQEFINSIAPLCVQYALKYKHNLVSPAIAQACLESGYGTSFKAQHHNYFGLKYRKNRVTCHNGYFKDDSKEQRADGSYEPIVDDWYSFEDMEHGVEGYYQFINIDYYKELKGMTSPLNYLYKLSELHYATALNYVENVNRVLVEHELYKYDEVLEGKRKESSEAAPFTSSQEEPYHFTNSPLVTVSKPSRYNGGQRQHKIDTITIHCYVGQVTALQGVNYFNTINRQASCNYVVGKDGDIGLSTDEGKRSFCSSNRANDERAVTIETASDTTAPYKITDKALNSLILLCADICKRNNIKELKWSDNKDDRVNHRNGVNMTCHRDYAKKSCPGDYIYSKEGYIAEEVNKILKGTKPESSAAAPSTSSIYDNEEYKSFNFIKYSDDYADLKKAFGYNKKLLYKHYIEYGKKEVRKVSFDLLIQQGYLVQIKITDLNIREDATTKSKSKGYIKPGIYTIIEEENGFGKLKSGVGWVSLKYVIRLT